MKILTKKATLAVSLLMALSLSGCFQEVPSDKDSKSSTQSSPRPSASVEATTNPGVQLENEIKVNDDTVNPETTKEIKKAAETNKEYFEEYKEKSAASPFGIDVDSFVADYSDPQVNEIFPDLDTEEGARTALDFYQKIITNGTLYKERDASKDFEAIVNVQPMMTQELEEKIQKGIKTNHRLDIIPTSNANGVLAVIDGKEIRATMSPSSNVWANRVSVEGEHLIVDGYTESTFYTEDMNSIKMTYNWRIYAIPATDSKWQIEGITYSHLENK